MLKLLGQLLYQFLRLGSCCSPVIPTTIIDPFPACKSTGGPMQCWVVLTHRLKSAVLSENRHENLIDGSHSFEKGPVLMVIFLKSKKYIVLVNNKYIEVRVIINSK